MDSQGRSRLIVGGLSLAAVLLVISLLLTQQDGGVPVASESPLGGNGSLTPLVEAAAVDGDDASVDATPASATSVEQPESPLAGTTGTNGSSVPNADRTPAQSTVTLTLAAPFTATSTAPTPTVQVTTPITSPAVALYDYAVVATYPHDPNAFTQGLQYVDGVLYEGTGLYGRSSLRRVDLESGTIEQQIDIPQQYFGEGIYVLEDRIFQLTWKSGVAFVYDRASFAQVDEFSYATEGWGLTFDGEALLMSDGSATIVRRSPVDFAEVGRFVVLEQGEPVVRLNELEYIEGELWANVWQTDDVVIVEPLTGAVVGRVDFAGLLPPDDAVGVDVLNGIAYDEANGRIFVTGKLWPTLFEIELVPR